MRTRRSVGMLGVLLAVWPANTQAAQFEHKQQGREPFPIGTRFLGDGVPPRAISELNNGNILRFAASGGAFPEYRHFKTLAIDTFHSEK